jgi:hypothetical protein
MTIWLVVAVPARAEFTWTSVTIDNDEVFNDDSGYTSGFFISLYEYSLADDQPLRHDFLVSLLMWSLPENSSSIDVNSYSLGQMLSTPSDLRTSDPDDDELPYSALLVLTNSYMRVTPEYADMVVTTIGIVGPAAMGEPTQSFVHQLIDAPEPQGWDTQLKNEPVFQFSRSRTWRIWAALSEHSDLLVGGRLSLGTISSSVSSSAYVRYGRNLRSSYASVLLASSRTSNPISVDSGWNLYAGVSGGYMFNQIVTDGNTFRSSRSIEYRHEFIGVSAGACYSWGHAALTFAVSDANILDQQKKEVLHGLTQFGSLTFAWRF